MVVVRALIFLFAFACSTEPNDAGSDVAMDAAVDGGVLEFECKAMTCNASEQYCKLTPVGACTLDAGTCAPGQDECITTGIGCTPERTPSCEGLAGCTNCQCLFDMQPCGAGQISIRCLSSGGKITLECPYP